MPSGGLSGSVVACWLSGWPTGFAFNERVGSIAGSYVSRFSYGGVCLFANFWFRKGSPQVHVSLDVFAMVSDDISVVCCMFHGF